MGDEGSRIEVRSFLAFACPVSGVGGGILVAAALSASRFQSKRILGVVLRSTLIVLVVFAVVVDAVVVAAVATAVVVVARGPESSSTARPRPREPREAQVRRPRRGGAVFESLREQSSGFIGALLGRAGPLVGPSCAVFGPFGARVKSRSQSIGTSFNTLKGAPGVSWVILRKSRLEASRAFPVGGVDSIACTCPPPLFHGACT